MILEWGETVPAVIQPLANSRQLPSVIRSVAIAAPAHVSSLHPLKSADLREMPSVTRQKCAVGLILRALRITLKLTVRPVDPG